MEPEIWVSLIIVAAIAAALAGFLAGRMSAAGEKEVRAMAAERDAAKQEADNMRSEMSHHFEESARMFGRLASDYRSFFEHFAKTAQNLGMSEGRARELLEQADPRLAERDDAIDHTAPSSNAANESTHSPAPDTTAADEHAAKAEPEPGHEESTTASASGDSEADEGARPVATTADAIADTEAGAGPEPQRRD